MAIYEFTPWLMGVGELCAVRPLITAFICLLSNRRAAIVLLGRVGTTAKSSRKIALSIS